MVLILYKFTNIFDKYVLIFHKPTLFFDYWTFLEPFSKHFSGNGK